MKKLLNDSSVKKKEKIMRLAEKIQAQAFQPEELLSFSDTTKMKEIILEVLEHLSKKENPFLKIDVVLAYANTGLRGTNTEKRESGRLIGNIIGYSEEIPTGLVDKLVKNTDLKEGTVTRWSAAYALTEIYRSFPSEELQQQLEICADAEEKESIRKIYEMILKET